MANEDKLMSRVVTLLTEDEKDKFEIIARKESRSMSGHMRHLVLEEIERYFDD